MRFKILHKTCIALILTIGFGLSGASATYLTVDWTGQCDDCQSADGPNTVPLAAMNDGFYQTVYGQLILRYEGVAEDQGTLTKENFVSFYYAGSNILDPFTFTAEHFFQKAPGSLSNDTEFSATLRRQDNGTLSLSGFSLTNLAISESDPWMADAYRHSFEFVSLTFESLSNTNPIGNWNINVALGQLITEQEVDPCASAQSSTRPECGAPNLHPECGEFGWYAAGNHCHAAPYNGGGFRDIGIGSAFSHFNQVPEPSTLTIFALGLMGLASRRFKKQA